MDINKIIKQLQDEGIDVCSAADAKQPMIWTPSGSLSIDVAIGGSGYPRGKVIEVYGLPSAGKSLLTLMAASIVTRNKGYVVLWDGEGNHDSQETSNYRDLFSIDPNYVIDIGRQPAHKVINTVNKLIKKLEDRLHMVIIDSVGALVTEEVLGKNAEDATVADVARLMNRWVRIINAINRHATVFMVNHLSTQIGTYKTPLDSKGGWGLKYFSSLRMNVVGKKIYGTDKSKGAIGQEINVKIEKNKLDTPNRGARMLFDMKTKRFDIYEELLTLASDHDLIHLKGSYYVFQINGQEHQFKGREKAKEFLHENRKVTTALVKKFTNAPPESYGY